MLSAHATLPLRVKHCGGQAGLTRERRARRFPSFDPWQAPCENSRPSLFMPGPAHAPTSSREMAMKRYLRPQLAFSLSLALLPAVTIAAEPGAPSDSLSERPTFYRDVLPILQANCQDCHREAGNSNSGMVAPMALADYDEVRPWAKSIAKVTAARDMPAVVPGAGVPRPVRRGARPHRTGDRDAPALGAHRRAGR